jgi:hypothetical protein
LALAGGRKNPQLRHHHEPFAIIRTRWQTRPFSASFGLGERKAKGRGAHAQTPDLCPNASDDQALEAEALAGLWDIWRSPAGEEFAASPSSRRSRTNSAPRATKANR